MGLSRRQAAQDFPTAFLAEHPVIEQEIADLAAVLIGQSLRESWQRAGFTSKDAMPSVPTTAEELGARFSARRDELLSALADDRSGSAGQP